MLYPYTVFAERQGERRKEHCTSASEALVWVEELREHDWTKITFSDEIGHPVSESSIKEAALDTTRKSG